MPHGTPTKQKYNNQSKTPDTMKTKYMTVAEGGKINIHQYPNFHTSGSIAGMKKLYYGRNALLVRCGQYIFNVPQSVYDMAK